MYRFETTLDAQTLRVVADLFGGSQRFQHAGDDLKGSRARHFIVRLAFEHFGVGEDDPQLVVQLVKQRLQLGVLPDRVVLQIRHAVRKVHTPRSADAIAVAPWAGSGRVREASRHRVSA